MRATFDRICSALSLGEQTADPQPLRGGYTHRMYAVTTTHGRYAVKLLNPEIMRRPDALDNYRRAEGFETLLEVQCLPILPAMDIFGRKLQCVDGQYLYVFRYYEGHALQDGEITPDHCHAMGGMLARIHQVARRRLPGEAQPAAPIDWDGLTSALLACPDAHTEGLAMQAALPMLHAVTRAAGEAALRLPRRETLCHNDMDAKNVLWQGDEFRVIDLESLGFADPLQELLDLAVSWAGHDPQEDCFKAFLYAYQYAGGEPLTDAVTVFDSRRNHIDWLAYNAARALSPAAAEARTGREQITETLDKIAHDQLIRDRILRWCQEL